MHNLTSAHTHTHTETHNKQSGIKTSRRKQKIPFSVAFCHFTLIKQEMKQKHWTREEPKGGVQEEGTTKSHERKQVDRESKGGRKGEGLTLRGGLSRLNNEGGGSEKAKANAGYAETKEEGRRKNIQEKRERRKEKRETRNEKREKRKEKREKREENRKELTDQRQKPFGDTNKAFIRSH